ncbi:MAG: glycosyltransferase family 2 protein [Fimbriimonadales bacterium]
MTTSTSEPGAQVSVVIVNYRTKELTAKAAESALAEPDCLEVIVVDNQSGDGSAEFLREKLASPRLKLIECEQNRGFGAGNNVGAAAASGRVLFLLNSDATFTEGALRPLVEMIQADPTIGIVAPLIVMADGKTPQQDAFGIMPTFGTILTRKTKRYDPGEVEPGFVSGTAMLMRTADYRAVGGFDERIFMYYEDVELCYRFRQRGFRIVRCLDSTVVHIGGQSYRSTYRQKHQYYQAQDLYLRLIGTPTVLRWGLRLLRWPNLILGQILGR